MGIKRYKIDEFRELKGKVKRLNRNIQVLVFSMMIVIILNTLSIIGIQ